MMESGKITRVILSDRTVVDPEIVSFVVDCLRETGGIRKVLATLIDLGYPDVCDRYYSRIDEADVTGELLFQEYSIGDLRQICRSIVETLDRCRDLETLLRRDLEESNEMLERL